MSWPLPRTGKEASWGPKDATYGVEPGKAVSHLVFKGIPDEPNLYFVHSYYVDPDDKSLVVGETDYGITMCSVIARGNLAG